MSLAERHARSAAPVSDLVAAFLAALLLLPAGCGPGLQDFAVSLGGGYLLVRCNPEEILVTPKVWDDTTPVIPATVTHLSFDALRVYAKRTPPRTQKTEYWILETQKPRVHGPLTLGAYRQMLGQLGVRQEPVLTDVHEFYRYRNDNW
jgi:hypothetical protein